MVTSLAACTAELEAGLLRGSTAPGRTLAWLWCHQERRVEREGGLLTSFQEPRVLCQPSAVSTLVSRGSCRPWKHPGRSSPRANYGREDWRPFQAKPRRPRRPPRFQRKRPSTVGPLGPNPPCDARFSVSGFGVTASCRMPAFSVSVVAKPNLTIEESEERGLMRSGCFVGIEEGAPPRAGLPAELTVLPLGAKGLW